MGHKVLWYRANIVLLSSIEDRTILVPHPLGALDNFVNEIRAQNVLIHEL